jgi:flagellar hook-associated protein 2
MATQMNNTLTTMLSTSRQSRGDPERERRINKTLKTLGERYDAMEAIDATMARYKAQFTSLDVLVTKMTSTANYLTQQFSQNSRSLQEGYV